MPKEHVVIEVAARGASKTLAVERQITELLRRHPRATVIRGDRVERWVGGSAQEGAAGAVGGHTEAVVGDGVAPGAGGKLHSLCSFRTDLPVVDVGEG